MEILDQEKFKTIKELSEVSSALSDARNALQKLKMESDKYMVIREKEAEERVFKILKESRDALEETTKNHKELVDFKNELKAYANKIKDLSTDIIALFQDFNTRMEKADKDMIKNREEVNEILKLIKIERLQVKEDRKMLKIEEKRVEDSMKLLKDRRETLERGFEELKKKKLKVK